ncbi:sugar porter family MFS transporter [Agrococcus sp. SGAir0287]|uniref:sugar porter family MFS transporter n=1 Tax=Agrococcus sp. SGAir0287 TaxID=2070347 RepID=UPI0010CD42DE|nr:sugar porter family MFS transporter [Agrococcus sp. SGAir0287]QCR20225.1 MFS transporter [Agrococcus sp. SGAir0287]
MTAPSAPATLPPLGEGSHRRRLGLVSIVACLGGLLFGYDTGVINGALLPMTQELGLTPFTQGVATSSLVFAAAIGALVGGRVSDARGRRATIVALAVLFFVGALVVVAAPSLPVLVLGRVLLGLAVGGASTVVPVYLSELAPYEIRGSLSGRNELAIVSGQLAAFVVNAILGAQLGHVEGVWRIMFAVCALPAAALFVGMLRMPESPRWLVDHGRRDEALAVLGRIRTPERAAAELAEIEALVRLRRADRVTIGDVLRDRRLLAVLLTGIGLGIGQQVTGINAIMYYGQTVLVESGFERQAALVANVAPGVIAVVGGLVALWMMDRVDRRTTFVLGFALTTFCQLLIGVASLVLEPGDPARPIVILALVVAFVGAMQTFLNVAFWVTLSEIFPMRMRGLGVGAGAFANWIANATLALAFPTLVASVGISGTFFGFAALGACALLFVLWRLPESRGRTLEAIEADVVGARR